MTRKRFLLCGLLTIVSVDTAKFFLSRAVDGGTIRCFAELSMTREVFSFFDDFK
jgi:hypothetical protein